MSNISVYGINISGQFAFFKQPDTNKVDTYFTYSHIHKPCILGIFGSILGLDKDKYYDKLKHLKIAIVPNKPYFIKGKKKYNNTVGFANNRMTLNVTEQYLEDVSWDIYIMSKESDKLFQQLKYSIQNYQSVYHVYLGRKEHMANIKFLEDIQPIKVKESEVADIPQIHSLFPYNLIKDIDNKKPDECNGTQSYFLREIFPVGYNDIGLYEYDTLIHTNHEIWELQNTNNLYKINNNILYFI